MSFKNGEYSTSAVYGLDTVMGGVGALGGMPGLTVSSIYFVGRNAYDSGLIDSRGAGYSRSNNIYTGDVRRSWARLVATSTMLPNFKR